MRVKIKPADKLFSDEIRDRDKWRCQRCGKQKDPNISTDRMGLDCSHFWRRGNKKTRFDPRNCDALCYGCHRIWDSSDGRRDYENFKKKQLGEEGYEELEKRSRMNIKFGDYEFKEMAKFLRKNGLNGIEEYLDKLI